MTVGTDRLRLPGGQRLKNIKSASDENIWNYLTVSGQGDSPFLYVGHHIMLLPRTKKKTKKISAFFQFTLSSLHP